MIECVMVKEEDELGIQYKVENEIVFLKKEIADLKEEVKALKTCIQQFAEMREHLRGVISDHMRY